MKPTQFSTVIYGTRPMIDLPTTVLKGLSGSLNKAIKEEAFEGLDPIMVEGIKATWRGDLLEIKKELIARN
jgi:hypothetical protein